MIIIEFSSKYQANKINFYLIFIFTNYLSPISVLYSIKRRFIKSKGGITLLSKDST
jgi:hypothetical protein